MTGEEAAALDRWLSREVWIYFRVSVVLGVVAMVACLLGALASEGIITGLLVGSGIVMLGASGLMFVLMLWAEADLHQLRKAPTC